jgi:hypothetical protein
MMMRTLLTAIALCAVSATVSAQSNEIPMPKRHYINLAYANQKLEFEAFNGIPAHSLKSDHGTAIEFGTTYFFNGRKPVADMIRFGLDWSYADLQYAAYKIDVPDIHGDEIVVNTETGHFANIGMQVGPSVTFSPVKYLNAKAYIHYAPSVTGYAPVELEDIKFGYTGYITGGLQVSYRFVTLGFELRGGNTKLSTLDDEVLDEAEEFNGNVSDFIGPKVKTKLSGARFILGFRF